VSLIEHSMPAERERGCSWADAFESQAAVEAYGATVNGAPTFSARDGVTLDGTNDYLQYVLTGQEFNSAGLSIVVEFTPDFEATEDAIRYMFQAKAGGTGCLLVKSNAGASYTLGLHLGGTSIAQIPLATYRAAWLTGKRNVLVVSGTTGDTSAWLNGTKILDADATAWTPEAATDMGLGAASGGGSKFDGTIHRLQVFKTQLEDQEALDICAGNTYRYLDDASLILTGAMECHDPTGHRALDLSGNGNHVTLGDGAGTGEPTKLPEHGYSFDGVDDYLDGLPALTGSYTASILDRDVAGAPEITHETVASVYTDIGTSGAYAKTLLALVACPEVLTSLQRLDLEHRMRSWARRT
jgi:hypothetical protein